jgi:DNA-binding response OmpR family regulator
MPVTVLVVEDEAKIRELLRSYLEREGFEVLSTGSGAEAIGLAESARPDLVVLDLRLPDVPGEAVAAEVRRFSAVPMLILTAKSGEEDRIRGLELGADDYVTKPFSPREVVLRVQAILRRAGAATNAAPASFGEGELVIDEDRRLATVRGEPVELTPTEWGILAALSTTPGRVYSRYELINRVRGYEFEGYERTIDSHVKNLRRKIERDPRDPAVVETVLGAGYRLGLSRDA